MGVAKQAPEQIISLLNGDGAVRGIGETFAPDLQNDTPTFRVDRGAGWATWLQPRLDLTYRTGYTQRMLRARLDAECGQPLKMHMLIEIAAGTIHVA